MGSGQSTLQVSEEGFHILADNLGTYSISSSTTTATLATTVPNKTSNNNNNNNELSNYKVQNGLYPGSGRMIRTYRIIQQNTNSNNNNTNQKLIIDESNQQQQSSQASAVLKAGWILCKPPTTTNNNNNDPNNANKNNDDDNIIKEYIKELQRIKDICTNNNLSHIAPIIKWYIGTDIKTFPKTIMTSASIINGQSITQSNITYVKPIYMLRQYIYTTLADRLVNRPWLNNCEKLFILYQILIAIQQLHNNNIIHGFITTENIGITSNGYVILLDINIKTYNNNSLNKTKLLPDNDPTDYLYYYQSQNYQEQYNNNNNNNNNNNTTNNNTNTNTSYFQSNAANTSTNNNATTTTNTAGNTSTTSTISDPTSTNINNNNNNTTLSSTTNPSNKISSERRCYLAPERFYTPSNTNVGNNKINDSDDTKSALVEQSSIDTKDNSTTTTNLNNNNNNQYQELTPEMDIFSLGCVVTELFLNGERCLDLGELMEYRRQSQQQQQQQQQQNLNNNNNNNNNILPITLQQKLNKIESSTIRACCKHMLSINPKNRLTAKQYYERLYNSNQFTMSFPLLLNIIQCITIPLSSNKIVNNIIIENKLENNNDNNINNNDVLNNESNNNSNDNNLEEFILNNNVPSVCPDARICVAASVYGKVLWECMGIRDKVGEEYFKKSLGETIYFNKKTNNDIQKENVDVNKDDNNIKQNTEDEKKDETTDELFLQVEALLKDLEMLDNDLDLKKGVTNQIQESISTEPSNNVVMNDEENTVERTPLCKSSILIYLQLILSTIRNVQRPSTKLIALQLIDRISKFCGNSNDEARLERIVPVTISLLEDQDSLVRALAIQVLTNTLSIIQTFPPSDSKIFPEYIFKRVAHLISDPSLIVRLAFTRCIAMLAETANRFLDITHAVRLYEAVGNDNGNTTNSSLRDKDLSKTKNVFGDDVAKLLDSESQPISRIEQADNSSDSNKSESIAGKTLIISSSYSTELTGLHETVSRWVVHITTDQSEHSSLQKRSVLNDLGRLCSFFGLDGVMSFILPQILAFLNERKDWELRAALFEHLPSVCHIIGRAATEEFVLPCVEIGLVDCEERVVCYALSCLCTMVEMGLLSRIVILGIDSLTQNGTINDRTFLKKYGVLLLHPSEDIRQMAIKAYVTLSKAVGSPDRNVYILPQLKPYFRFKPQASHLLSMEGMHTCLHPPWSRKKYKSLLKSLIKSNKRDLSIPGAWTSIGVLISEDPESMEVVKRDKEILEKKEEAKKRDPQMEYFHEYLKMVVKQTAQTHSQVIDKSVDGLSNGIEGPVKLAQSIMFPRQNGKFYKNTLPEWYSSLRDKVESNNSLVSEASTIKSISSLGCVYGLSIMGPVAGVTENIVGAADVAQTTGENEEIALQSSESKMIEASSRGEWGSETMLDPHIVDTCLLIPKLKALGVPPLPPKLGELGVVPMKRIAPIVKDSSMSVESKGGIKGLVATSLTNSGHTAPVVRLAMSKDQYFFVSGSHDGTCRVWDIPQIDDSFGVLESSLVYSEHSRVRPTRINDVAMLEGSHSVASGASDGSIHVWRVDMVQSENQTTQMEQRLRRGRSRVIGTSCVRKVESNEGEILAVSHFNSSAGSVVTYATQRGVVHTWDLRCAKEPFTLKHSPDLGYMSSMALGNDRYWMVTGTSKGYMTLWDIRFHQPVKLWQHSRKSPITRLATSCVLPPQTWNMPNAVSGGPLPYIFVASGSNECSMFDATTGSCSECFRTVVGSSRSMNSNIEEPPQLIDTPMHSRTTSNNMVKAANQQFASTHVSPVTSINCMVGSIGANSDSYLVTGGSDCTIRFWDFWSPSKCYVITGRRSQVQQRPSIERIDFDSKRRLMLCRESMSVGIYDNNKLSPQKTFHGLKKEEHHHSDSIQDIKIIDNSTIISCSRDSTIKVWK